MTIKTHDIKAFETQIAKLRIEVAQNPNGVFTVCSSSEPLFCYDTRDEHEIETLVRDTLASYAKHFFNLHDVEIGTKTSSLFAGNLPVEVERAHKISTLEPVLKAA